ncbi:MAG: LytR/AlgR family response regulator transcription factor [Sphingomonadales bacterium]
MSETLRCICVDDEPLALEVMQTLLESFPGLKLEKTFSHALKAIDYLKNNKVHVVFSDINMPGVSGIEFARSIADNECVVVFTTAHQEYAAEAFEIEALDFLLKPISPDRLAKTVKRLEEYFELRSSLQKDNSELSEGSVFVKSDGKLLKVAFTDIWLVEAFADYVKIWTSDDKRIVTLQTMKNMEQGLPEDRFIRVHRSFIVAIDKMVSVHSSSIKVGNKEIPVGKNYRDGLMEIVQRLNTLRR